MQAVQHRQRDDLSLSRLVSPGLGPFRKLLPDPLMRPAGVEVGDVFLDHAMQLLVAEDEQVIQALPSHTPQKPLAHRIGLHRGLHLH